MNKYRNRSGLGSILTDKQLSGFAEIVICISSGLISPVFSETNNSNPTSFVCLNPVKKIDIQRSYIGLEQWNEVLKPVIEKVSPLIGKLPSSSAPLTFKDKIVGYSTYTEVSLGSLYEAREDSLLDLVKKMLLKQAKEKGYGT